MPKKYNLIIGRHCLLKAPKYLPGAVEEAVSYGANSLMVFLGAPQNSYRPPLENLKIPEFKQILAQNKLESRQVIIHGPYLINLANASNPQVFFWSVEFLKKELIRAEKIGAKIFVLHPGSALKSPLPAALDQVVKGLDLALQTNSQIRVALETMSGRGSEVGSNFAQLQAIIKRVKYKERVGVCWDTCHLWAAGYDLKNNLEQIISDFEEKIGLEKLWVIHVNDSLFELGSKQDRHQNLGYGKIGWIALQKIVYHPKFEGIVKILETPRELNFQTEIKRLKEQKPNCVI